MEIQYIPLEPAHWKDYRALRLEALKTDPDAYTYVHAEELKKTNDYWQDRFRQYVNGETGLMFGAFVEGKVVGMMGATWKSKKRLRHIATLAMVYVAPEYRKQNVASGLMEQVLSCLKEENTICKVILRVTARKKPAVSFYKRSGFREVGLLEKEIKFRTKYLDVILMEKLL